MNLFKLTKDGKCVGYELHAMLPNRNIIIMHSEHGRWAELGCYNIVDHPKEYIQHTKKYPFVCDDKNGEKVFAGDFVWFFWIGKKLKAKINKEQFFIKVISCEGECRGLPRTLCKSDIRHIELINSEKDK